MEHAFFFPCLPLLSIEKILLGFHVEDVGTIHIEVEPELLSHLRLVRRLQTNGTGRLLFIEIEDDLGTEHLTRHDRLLDVDAVLREAALKGICFFIDVLRTDAENHAATIVLFSDMACMLPGEVDLSDRAGAGEDECGAVPLD